MLTSTSSFSGEGIFQLQSFHIYAFVYPAHNVQPVTPFQHDPFGIYGV